YPAGGPHAEQLGGLVDEALSLGVARHVVRLPAWAMGAGYDRDGRLVSVDLEGRVVRWDLPDRGGTLVGRHPEEVWSARVSPDGTRIAVGGQGGMVAVYPLDGSGEPLRLGSRHSMSVERLEFSADGQRLLTWNKSRVVQVWDLATGTALLELADDKVMSGAMDPRGSIAYAGLASGEIIRATIGGGKSRLVRLGDKPVAHVLVSPGGDRLLAHSMDGTVRLIDVATGKARVLGHQPAEKATAAFSRDGSLVASGGIDKVIHIWRTADGSRADTLRGHEDSIYQVEFAPDASYLASAGDDGTARVWDLRSGQSQVLRGHEDDVFSLSIRRDGRELLTTSLDGSVRLWPIGGDERVLVAAPGKEIDHVLFSGDGAQLYATGKGGRLLSWELASGERTERTMVDVEKSSGYPVFDRTVSRVAVPRTDGAVELWDAASGKPRILRGGQGGPVAVAMSRDGKVLVSSEKKGGTTLVWDLSAAEPAPRVLFKARPLAAMNLSHDGSTLVVRELIDREAHTAGALELWDVASGERRASIDPAASGLGHIETPSLAFSPDGRHVIGHGKKGTSLLWKVEESALHSFGRTGFYIQAVEYSPDGRRVAASMSDRTVLLWDLETLRTRILHGHRDLVFQVAFSPDGETLASASYDRTVRLWNAHSGASLRVLRGHTAAVMGVAFSPDGALLASGSVDGTVRLWDLGALPSTRPDAVRARIDRATTARIQGSQAASPVTSPD
ncbi:MAG TPA: WD40 repeat domain-containing protein, partial [Kofleriaceae bacterium]|nr:WD40 repeat domain-containing protein [Kofleriaceae bacterium]